MIEIFLKTVPFFALIGLGYWAGYTRFFTEEATAYLTKFVFYFALTAMLFRFSANLSLADVWDANLVSGYLFGTMAVYLIATVVAYIRKLDVATSAVEAQCAAIGNVGFLGVPMLTLLMGEAAIGPIMMALAVDLIVFSSLIVILITGSRDGRVNLGILRTVGLGLIRNPMIVAIVVGLAWSYSEWPIPAPANEFLSILGGAATPGALFAIGASLASKSAERLQIAGWLTFCKLGLHPFFVAIGVLYLFPADPYFAAVIIAAAALPVAGNVYILAQHYGVAPHRVSAAILVSTMVSIITVSGIIAWVSPV
ncbi:AEC family transporter [Roseobacter sp. YSTF-M11]|uniref:AEC family transporter n=1 Tax=Roseobacter insulae TaxID=2859783 RepID=A0A9X1FT33_9RHOB|nr:AEC family transporter [Roseobacter insulae]MBW4706615.1 AEC family transporter [Roseobacter insulae]